MLPASNLSLIVSTTTFSLFHFPSSALHLSTIAEESYEHNTINYELFL